MDWFITFVAAYLLGSLSPAYILGRIFLKKDLSKEGSGNLGANNSFRVGGHLLGISVFLLDCLKGVGILLWIKATYDNSLLLYWGAVAVIFGHNFSVYLGFRGGKGLATMVGILSVLNVYVLLVLGALAGLFAFLSHHSGVGAILVVIPFALIFGLIAKDWQSLPFTLALSGIILVKHRPEEYRETARFLRLIART